MKRTPKETVVYQIYPRSFNDTDNDGIGDIRGIIEKLDYLETLGVDMLWLTPFYISPGNDNGYDIADYYHVDPVFGSDQDIEDLITAAQARNIGIMLDMVFNHTSTAHEWFEKAIQGDKVYQSRYIFRDKKTNWLSKFGGSAWEYAEEFNLYYLHLFDVTQADLNWENPDVFREICNITNYWLDKGVSGLRFDVINLISKPAVFEDDHQGDGRRFYTDGPHVHEYIQALNKETFGQRNDIITVGELSSTSLDNAVQYARSDGKELSTVFGFHHLKVDYYQGNKWELQPVDFLGLKKILSEWQMAMQEADATAALFWCNHDQPRIVSRFGNDVQYPFESASMLATVMHLMRGMPYIYQGEEIGMTNAYFSSIEDYRDIESTNMYKELMESKPVEEVMEIIRTRSRDNSRTPIPWNNEIHHGFSQKKPWIDFSHLTPFMTVEEALNDHESIFYWYRKLIKIRHDCPIVSHGVIEFIDLEHPACFNYRRHYQGQHWLVINNFTEQEIPYSIPENHGRIYLSNVNRKELSQQLILQPYESLILESFD